MAQKPWYAGNIPLKAISAQVLSFPLRKKPEAIEHLGRVVMREVFATVKRWKLQGILPGRVAINISPSSLAILN